MFDFQGAANFSFLFYYRCSDIGIPFIRSRTILQQLKPWLHKDYMNINLTSYKQNASPRFMRQSVGGGTPLKAIAIPTPNPASLGLWCRASRGGC